MQKGDPGGPVALVKFTWVRLFVRGPKVKDRNGEGVGLRHGRAWNGLFRRGVDPEGARDLRGARDVRGIIGVPPGEALVATVPDPPVSRNRENVFDYSLRCEPALADPAGVGRIETWIPCSTRCKLSLVRRACRRPARWPSPRA